MWLQPQGFAEIISPDEDIANLDRIRKERLQAGTNRLDTCTCNHCGRVFHVSAKMRPEDIGGLCHQCMKPICPTCLDKGCKPFEQRLLEEEARSEALRSYGL